MSVQSMSVVVPAERCINKCKFCVACTTPSGYENAIGDINNMYMELNENEYVNRLNRTKELGCNVAMLTGDCEPLQNRQFLRIFRHMVDRMHRPFDTIELQTAGNLLDDAYLFWLRHFVKVTTISLSISSFNNLTNAIYNGFPGKTAMDIKYICSRIKQYRFNLRVSVNLTDEFDDVDPAGFFHYCKEELGADQVTLRELFRGEEDLPENLWIDEHSIDDGTKERLFNYIKSRGEVLERLPYNNIRYDVHGMSIVADTDCMAKDTEYDMKYLILRPDCKLYSKWHTKASKVS